MTFEAHGGSLALPTIIKRDIAVAGYTESSPPSESQMDALHEAANNEVLSRIFLDSLNSQCDDFGRGIENAFTDGRDIYPFSVAETLD